MNHLWIGILIGIASYYIFERTLMRLVRRHFDPTHTKAIRKNLLDKMGYDALIAFQRAVEFEIAKRRGRN